MIQLFKYLTPCLLFALNACTERIDVDLPTSFDRLVVDGKFTTDLKQHTVILSRTMDYFDPNPDVPYISDATLRIIELETGVVYPLHLLPGSPGHYNTKDSVAGIQGYSYKLQIEGVDIDGDGITESYEATDFMPYITDKIDSIKTFYGYNAINDLLGFPQSEYKGWNVLLYMQDLPTHEYYLIVSIHNGVEFSDLREKSFWDDEIFGPEGSSVYLNGAPVSFISDTMDYQVGSGGTIGLIVESTSKDYFTYLLDVKDIHSGGNPMMGNPANVRGNVNNGAVGYFATYSLRSLDKFLENSPPKM